MDLSVKPFCHQHITPGLPRSIRQDVRRLIVTVFREENRLENLSIGQNYLEQNPDFLAAVLGKTNLLHLRPCGSYEMSPKLCDRSWKTVLHLECLELGTYRSSGETVKHHTSLIF